MLARELGLLGTDPATQQRLREKVRHRQALEVEIAEFERWREARLRTLTERFRQLGRPAALAQQVLRRWRDCDAAWDAVARFYHGEAKLSAALDWLTFEK